MFVSDKSIKYHHQQVIHHHNASLVQNNYALKVTLKIKAGGEEASSVKNIVNNNVPHLIGRKTRISDEVYFLICKSCFWCASYISSQMPGINNYTTTMPNCPACLEETIESLPIALNEEYKFDYNNERGVILEFL